MMSWWHVFFANERKPRKPKTKQRLVFKTIHVKNSLLPKCKIWSLGLPWEMARLGSFCFPMITGMILNASWRDMIRWITDSTPLCPGWILSRHHGISQKLPQKKNYNIKLPPGKLTWQWKIHHLKMYFLLNGDIPMSCFCFFFRGVYFGSGMLSKQIYARLVPVKPQLAPSMTCGALRGPYQHWTLAQMVGTCNININCTI